MTMQAARQKRARKEGRGALFSDARHFGPGPLRGVLSGHTSAGMAFASGF
jgi:hypothetical protein